VDKRVGFGGGPGPAGPAASLRLIVRVVRGKLLLLMSSVREVNTKLIRFRTPSLRVYEMDGSHLASDML